LNAMSPNSSQNGLAAMPLSELADSVKSGNAGAAALTFEIGFETDATFQLVCHSGALSASVIAGRYHVDPAAVQIYHYAPARTIKITIPRSSFTRQLAETDFDGVQQHVLLLDIPIPLRAPEAIEAHTSAASRQTHGSIRPS
jgi:Domain of unknown function (DUF4387)